MNTKAVGTKYPTRWVILLVAALGTGMFFVPQAQAKRQIDVTAVSMPADVFMMAPTTNVSVSVRNSNTLGDVGLRINSVQFQSTNGYVWKALAFITPPAGWTAALTAGNTKLTFTTNNVANMITVNQSLVFNLVFGSIPQNGSDVTNEAWLNKVTANFDGGGGPANENNPGLTWNRRGLVMTLTATPATVRATPPDNEITLRMNITNVSNAPQSNIASNPADPAITTTATGFNITKSSGPVMSPLPWTLNPNGGSGSSGSITWTYTVTFAAGMMCPQAIGGTITFTARAMNTNVTSGPQITTTPVAVGCFTATLTAPACAAAGAAISVVMRVNNYNSSNMNNLRNETLARDASSTVTGTATCGAASYSSNTAPANSSSTTITWNCTLPATATPGQTYVFRGQVTGTLQSNLNTYITPPAQTAPITITGGGLTAVPIPSTVGSGSTNVLVTWTITNGGCGGTPLNNVQISIPAGGWTYLSSASIVNNLLDWTDTPTPAPPGTNLVTYAAGTVMPNGGDGEFSIVFSKVPLVQNPYVFNVQLTNTVGGVTNVPSIVTIGPPSPGGGANAGTTQELLP